MHGKQYSLYIDVEDRLVKFFGGYSKRGVLGNSRIGEDDIQSSLFLLDLREEPIQVGHLRNVSLNADHGAPDLIYGSRQFWFATTGDKNMRAFVYEPFCRRQTYPLVPPVTNAIFPSSLPIISSLLYFDD